MDIAKYIDHTLLKPDATEKDIIKLCEEAKKYGFASVCVNEYYTKLASMCLEETDILVCTVIGFPLGANDTDSKVYETSKAIVNGADEIDMVMNIGAFKDGKDDYVMNDINEVVAVAKGRTVKVILETCLLTNNEIENACILAIKGGAQFVKTSTGFSTAGASIENVKLMAKIVGEKARIKASGGIKNLETAIKMIEAGANRIGASASVNIVEEFRTLNKI